VPDLSSDANVVVLTFSGPATIANSQAIHARLLAALESGSNIDVECSGVTETDVSFAQLLLAAHRSSQGRRQRLTLQSPVGAAMRDMLLRAGLIGNAPRGADGDEAFWRGGLA